MKISAIPVFVATLLAASAVSADGVNYLSYGTEYANLSASAGDDLDIFAVGASTEVENDGFIFNGNFSFAEVSLGSDDIRLTGVVAHAAYLATPELTIFAGIGYVDIEDESLTTYNLGAEYSANEVSVAALYLDSDEDGFESQATLLGSYRTGGGFEGILSIKDQDDRTTTSVGVDYDNGTSEIQAVFTNTDSVSLFALSGKYDFDNAIRVSGDYINFDGDEDYFAVGAGYEVKEELWIDASLGRIDAEGSEADVFTLAVTYEIGDEKLLADRAETLSLNALGNIGAFVSQF